MEKKTSREGDETCAMILRYFYDRNRTATSVTGKKGAAVRISDLRRDLKKNHGLPREIVVANLNYLISRGMVERKPDIRFFRTNDGGQQQTATIYYIITAAGIDMIDGPSRYTPLVKHPGTLTVNANDRCTVVVGDGNRVDVRHDGLRDVFCELVEAVQRCRDLNNDLKNDAIGDIKTIHAQLSRSRPHSSTIQIAWESVQKLSKIADLAILVQRVGERLSHFFN